MVTGVYKRTLKESGFHAKPASCCSRCQKTLGAPLNTEENSMIAGADEPAPEGFRAKTMSEFRWRSIFDTLLNTVFDRVRTAFRTVPSKDRRLRNVELPHTELSLYEAAEIAKQEWLWAVAYFHEVSEPGLVDYAVYALQAAERKYMYLLDKARQDYASLE